MSRTIYPIGNEFPDFRLPDTGDWVFTVVLSKDDDCPMDAVVELLQDKSQIGGTIELIASMTVTVTRTPTPYSMTIEDFDKITWGCCSVSELMYRITAVPSPCSSSSSSSNSSSSSTPAGCCRAAYSQVVLRDGAGGALTMLGTTDRWGATGSLCGGSLFTWAVECDVTTGVYSLSTPWGGIPMTKSCSPFVLTCTGNGCTFTITPS